MNATCLRTKIVIIRAYKFTVKESKEMNND